MEKVDVIIIGSGQGGVPLAADLAEEGRDVVIFERKAWGGSCTNFGCTPSKTFLASAHVAGLGRHAEELGVHLETQIDFLAVIKRVRRIVGISNEGIQSRLGDAGVRMIEAEGTFTDVRTVSGGGVTVQAPLVIINTGKSPRILDIPGLTDTPYRTYETFWGLEQLPPRSLVLGAGYTGVELGQGLARLGSETHIIEVQGRPIPKEELEVSKAIGEALWEDGVEFHLNTKVQEVAFADGVFTLTGKQDGTTETLQGEMLLVSVGRVPNTAALNAEASEVELDEQGNVKVDDQFRSTCKGVYAIGDVTGQPAFTHVSYEDYRRLKSILRDGERRRGDRVLGYAFFTDPQVGRAGLTLDAAKEAGHNARAVKLPLEQVSRAFETGRTTGFYKMVVDQDNDQILGATLVGPQTAELIHVFIAHMEAGSTWQTLAESVHIHPSYAEGLPTLARKV